MKTPKEQHMKNEAHWRKEKRRGFNQAVSSIENKTRCFVPDKEERVYAVYVQHNGLEMGQLDPQSDTRARIQAPEGHSLTWTFYYEQPPTKFLLVKSRSS